MPTGTYAVLNRPISTLLPLVCRRLGRQHSAIATNAAAARTPSLFDDWLEPATGGGAPGVVAAAPDPCLTSYILPRAAPSASLGTLALEAAASLARLANSMAMQWGVGRAALSSLGLGEREPHGGPAFRGPLQAQWELVPGSDWLSGVHPPLRQAAGAAVAIAAAAAPDVREPAAPQESELRHEVTDRPRAVRQLIASPSGRATLSADDQGRVLLLDGADLAVLRMWKGYREATLGWLRASDGAVGGSDFIAVYAPRRNQVDLWDATAPAKLSSIKTRRRGGDAVVARMVYAAGRCFIVQLQRRPQEEQLPGGSCLGIGSAPGERGQEGAARPPPPLPPESAVAFEHRGASLLLRLQPRGAVPGVDLGGGRADLTVTEVVVEQAASAASPTHPEPPPLAGEAAGARPGQAPA